MTLKPGRDGELGKYKDSSLFRCIKTYQLYMIIYLCALVASIDKNLWLSPWGESVLSGSSTCIRVKLCIPDLLINVLIFIGGGHLQGNILCTSGYKT